MLSTRQNHSKEGRDREGRDEDCQGGESEMQDKVYVNKKILNSFFFSGNEKKMDFFFKTISPKNLQLRKKKYSFYTKELVLA